MSEPTPKDYLRELTDEELFLRIRTALHFQAGISAAIKCKSGEGSINHIRIILTILEERMEEGKPV